MISESPFGMDCGSLFFVVRGLINAPVYVKCEAFNVTGSIKIKPALQMVAELERAGKLRKGSVLIESSSGNLGLALSMIAAERGYQFICVTDCNAATHSVQMMEAFGAKVIIVREKDVNGGYLGSRLNLIKSMCEQDPQMVWINQYANDGNWRAHYLTTAPEIIREFPKVDWLFIGTGTTGTYMGCARYFREHSPTTRIVAVDPLGSVTFGGKTAKRSIPGVGTSQTPEIMDPSFVDIVVYVPEVDTVRVCREMTRRGVLIGGSTGTVLAGIQKFVEEHPTGRLLEPADTVVTISPDLGDKYLSTVYHDDWVQENIGSRTK